MSKQIIRIIGVGNPLMGDDGLGIHIIARLQKENVPDSIELIDGGCGGFSLLPLLTGCSQLTILDAADFGASPGTLKVLDNASLQNRPRPMTRQSHHLGLLEILMVAEKLSSLPPFKLYLIQIASCQPHHSLSEPVSTAAKMLTKTILKEIAKTPEKQ